MLLPGPSEPGPTNEDANEDTLLKLDGEFESGQQSRDRKRRQREGKNSILNKRPRHDGHSASALEKKIQSSESSIQKLKMHAEKKTCPKDLRYKVRVNIAPDQHFKSDICSRIRKGPWTETDLFWNLSSRSRTSRPRNLQRARIKNSNWRPQNTKHAR